MSVRGLCTFHKTTRAQAGNNLPLTRLHLSHFLCLTEVRLFILPQPVAVLGVDVKVPGACGAKGVRAFALLVCLYAPMNPSVYI